MPDSLDDIKERYEALDIELEVAGEEAIDPGLLLTFPYDYPDNPAEVVIDTDEFTAVCPWTGLPDTGELKITYIPSNACIELKSLKYYLLSFRQGGHRAGTCRQPHTRRSRAGVRATRHDRVPGLHAPWRAAYGGYGAPSAGKPWGGPAVKSVPA